MSLSKCVYRKDDCGKLKIKDSNHTRRSKQNTYHVVNKNIAPSKLPMEVDERGDAFRGLGLGVTWASPSLGSCHSLFHNPSKELTQNLKTSQQKTRQKSRELCQRKKTKDKTRLRREYHNTQPKMARVGVTNMACYMRGVTAIQLILFEDD